MRHAITSRLRSLHAGLCLFACLIAASLSAVAPPMQADPDRPNVLWLIAEDMGQQLGSYGYPISTPNLDRLSREGTQFNRAFCSSPICSPSRSAFTTGMYATAIHAQDHRTPQQRKRALPSGVTTIPKWFEQNGYHTSLMGSPKTDWNFLVGDNEYMGTDWSQREDGQPFFTMLNFLEPHRWGWSKWPELGTHLDPDAVPVPPIYPDGPIMRRSIAKYMDFIVEMDRKLGLVLDRLEDEGQLDNTIIFFFGDNGRTIYRGKQWLYDEGLRVPLIARYPSQFEPGSVNDDLISLVDLAPSSLALAGLPVPEKMQGKVRFGEHAAPPAKYVFASRDLSDQTQDLIRAARDKRYKYIRNYRPETGYPASPYLLKTHPEYTEARQAYDRGELDEKQSLFFAPRKPEEELYDIQADPWETENLADKPEYAQVLERMRDALDAWIESSGDVVLNQP